MPRVARIAGGDRLDPGGGDPAMEAVAKFCRRCGSAAPGAKRAGSAVRGRPFGDAADQGRAGDSRVVRGDRLHQAWFRRRHPQAQGRQKRTRGGRDLQSAGAGGRKRRRGPHACILHWPRNNGSVKRGSLLLVDAGVEGNSLYTADITRTLPISGKFTKEQREIYSLVHRAQAAGFRAGKPGNDFMEPNRVAMAVLAEGLERLGILPTTPPKAHQQKPQLYHRYS